MPFSSGPNTVNDSSIVFNYDIGDLVNSYKGEPTTNTVGGTIFNPLDLYTWASSGNTSTWTRDTSIDLSPVKGIPLKEISSGTDSYSNTYNGGYYNLGSAAVGQTWTVSIYAKAAAGTNLQIWLFGANSSGNYIELDAWNFTATGNWQRISGTRTLTNGSTVYVQARVATATNGGIIWWDGLQMEQKSYTTPFTSTSRSTTQALLDISGRNNTTTLNNMVYGANNAISFDGTNSFAGVGNLGNIGDFTVEILFKSDSVTNYRNPIDCNWLVYSGGYSNIGPRLEQNSSGNLGWIVGDASGNYTGLNVVTSGLNVNNYHYAAITRSSSYFTAYYNGSQSGTTTFNNWYGAFSNLNIGRGFSTSSERWFIGKIPIVKIYSRVLSPTEISNNYRQYKSRFNLP